MTALEQHPVPAPTDPILAAALDYVARGWYVLPCRVGTKQNAKGQTVKDVRLPKDWGGISTRDPATVQGWYGPRGPWHGGSVAVDTGKSGLVVVDLDTSGEKNGFAAWQELGGQVANYVNGTPSGGAHLFFQADPDRPVGTDAHGKLGHGIDVRAVGGLVIMPPSVDWRGNPYRETAAADWRNLSPVPGIVVERVPLGGHGAPSPSALAARSGGQAQRDPSGLARFVAGDGVPKYIKADADARMRGVLANVMATPEGSGFNHALNEAAFEIGHWVAGGYIGRADAESMLSYAVTAVFPHGPNGDDLATVESGLRSGEAKPYAVLPDLPASIVPGVDPSVDDALEQEISKQYWRLKATELARERLAAEKVIGEGDGKFDWDLLDQPPEPVEWLVPDVLAAGRSYALVGGAKAGKSYAARDFAVQAAEAGNPVLYLDRENTAKGDWVPHLRAMGVTRDISSRMDIRNFPAIAPLDTEVGGNTLVEWVKASGARVVFIDMLMRFLSGKENDSDTFNAYDRYTGQKLKAMGVTVVRLDHSGHDENGRARGSSAKAGDVDVQWMLTREGATVTLDPKGISRHADQRDSIRLVPQTGRLRVTDLEPPESDADEPMVTAVLEMLNDKDLTPRSSDRTVQERLRARGHKGRNEKMNKAWREALRRAGAAGLAPEAAPRKAGFTPTFMTQPVADGNRQSENDPGDHKINNSVGDHFGDQSRGSGITGISPGDMGPDQRE